MLIWDRVHEFRADDNSLAGVYLGNSTIANSNGEIIVSAENIETLLSWQTVILTMPIRPIRLERVPILKTEDRSSIRN